MIISTNNLKYIYFVTRNYDYSTYLPKYYLTYTGWLFEMEKDRQIKKKYR